MAESESRDSPGRVVGRAILMGVFVALLVALVTHAFFEGEEPMSTASIAGAAAAVSVAMTGARRRARRRRDPPGD